MSRQASQPRHLAAVLNSMQPGIAQEPQKRPALRTIYPPGTDLYCQPVIKSKGYDNDIAQMMMAYRRKIALYNKKVAIVNAPVQEYNKSVRAYRKTQREDGKINLEVKIKETIWKQEHRQLDPEDYNKMVQAYNKKNGLMLQQRLLKTPVKAITERYFAAFMYQYQHQINLHSQARRLPPLINTVAPLPPYKLYPNKIQAASQDNYTPLDVTPKTIRAHRDRMIEAGVLENLKFHGRERAVSMRVNKEILRVRDNAFAKAEPDNQKNTQTENQSLTKSERYKVPHSNVSSRSLFTKNKYREEGVFYASEKTTNEPAVSSTKSPKVQNEKKIDGPSDKSAPLQKKLAGPRKIVDQNPLSKALATAIEDPGDLVQALAKQKYQEYTPLLPEILSQEAHNGAMHPADFEELAIQDIFKYASILFLRVEKVHPGAWRNAYKLWQKEQFHSAFGKRLSKPAMLQKWIKCRDVIREVRVYADNHTEWQPQYPSLYFDPARKFKENNSFEYAYRRFRVNETAIPSREERHQKAVQDKNRKTQVAKARTKIRAYLEGKIDLQQVYDYTLHNLSTEMYQNINQLITREREAYLQS